MMRSGSYLNLNRRLHIHLGLILLLFIWLFSLSGLILNHGNWKFASFWDQRRESKIDFTAPLSTFNESDPKAGIMQFLNISGEVQEQKRTSHELEFRVQSPGTVRDV